MPARESATRGQPEDLRSRLAFWEKQGMLDFYGQIHAMRQDLVRAAVAWRDRGLAPRSVVEPGGNRGLNLEMLRARVWPEASYTTIDACAVVERAADGITAVHGEACAAIRDGRVAVDENSLVVSMSFVDHLSADEARGLLEHIAERGARMLLCEPYAAQPRYEDIDHGLWFHPYRDWFPSARIELAAHCVRGWYHLVEIDR